MDATITLPRRPHGVGRHLARTYGGVWRWRGGGMPGWYCDDGRCAWWMCQLADEDLPHASMDLWIYEGRKPPIRVEFPAKAPHVCQLPTGCICSGTASEPNERCPQHGQPDRRCGTCGRFLKLPP